jgi:flagellar biosynthesis protein FlhB
MTEVIICVSIVFAFGVWLIASVAWDIFRTLLDIKFELEDMNRELKQKNDKPWNYTMKELEAAIKHE